MTTTGHATGPDAQRIRAAGPAAGAFFDPQANSLDVLRLLFAVTVAITHACVIAYGWQPMIGATQIAILAVDGFFVLSGFLIVRSYLRLGSLPRYAWHRFLRIMPGFWLCLALTAFAVAPLLAWLEGRPAASVLTGGNPSWRYLAGNAGLYISSFDVAGLPTGTADPGTVNGALWTLFYEGVCYLAVAVLGALGWLRRRPWVVLVIAGASWAALAALEAGAPVRGEYFWRFFFLFFLGAAAYLYRDRIIVNGWLAAGAVPVVAASAALLHDYRPAGGLAFAYAVIWAGVATPRLRRHLRADFSYGIYIWHWPVLALLATAGAARVSAAAYFALGALLVAGAAYASWHLVEKRALALKDAGLPRRGR